MGKLKGRGEREFSGRDPVGSLSARSHTQDSNSLSGNYFTKVYNFFFSFWYSRCIFEGQSRESGIHYKHLFCKSEFTELQSSFSTVGKPSLLLTQWPTFKMNKENNVFFEVLCYYSRKACYAFQDNKDSQFPVIINTAFQYFFYFVIV